MKTRIIVDYVKRKSLGITAKAILPKREKLVIRAINASGVKVITADQVRSLREKIPCGMHEAKDALEKREGIEEYAIEYIQRKGLAAVMSEAARFPKWATYKNLR